jgi:hypothetical protein
VIAATRHQHQQNREDNAAPNLSEHNLEPRTSGLTALRDTRQ